MTRKQPPITALQQRVWDMKQSGMPLAAIAADLGVSERMVSQHVTAYRRKTGVQRSYGDGPAAQRSARLRELERLTVEQAERIADLEARASTLAPVHARLSRLEAKLDELLARPVGVPVISHRRQADGGMGGKQERKALRRVA